MHINSISNVCKIIVNQNWKFTTCFKQEAYEVIRRPVYNK